MRLIDGSFLEDRCKRQMNDEWNKKAAPSSWADAYEQFLTDIENAPTVDAVPVVRCGECKHWSRTCDESYLGEPGLGKCRNERFFAFEYGFETEDNFTCADGKHKGGDE